jgi:hypothetical protein
MSPRTRTDVPSELPARGQLESDRDAGIRKTHIIERDANPANIQHNKFMVLLKGKTPSEVWTGSTNISLGGFTGQTNVGHWVRNKTVARAFKAYWDLLEDNPGSRKGDTRTDANAKKKAYRNDVEKLHAVPTTIATIPKGITAVFSPRTGTEGAESLWNPGRFGEDRIVHDARVRSE